ncbi:ATP-dependent Lon protease [Desulfofundulus australicus DSM 11792]|uniref:ATP-dependent Lon protease n=1 Tax=Desulfofundulus australicus DSM 11792 TaxID=1121425 RepID=A0A1M4XEU5_9FIRM|nr:BREX system Lon protease-like protein BrxL [Desulfofundulus australicus]SHE91903.1 ATP-dependent Lon protease [Desulfofundulus australicus DSM 11792]
MGRAINENIAKLKSIFSEMLVYKNPQRNKFFSALGIPSYLRDWLVMRFADGEGRINIEEVNEYVRQYIPRREQWELMKKEMSKEGRRIRFLAKIRVEMDVRTGEGLFSLPDLGFPGRKYEALIADHVLREKKEALFTSSETWGIVELEWRMEKILGRQEEGRVFLIDFKPFRPYRVDLEFYQEARKEFNLEEWIDILLMAVDYNPAGFLSIEEKLTMLSRLLPFVEKRVNIIELAPKGTGKSYLFSQISKYGWLVSGGSISRARLFYDLSRRSTGLVSRYDYVALDEIQSISFPDEEEVRGALKGYLESGEYRVGDYRGVGEAGFVLLGNISEDNMNENTNMFRELPAIFHESALIDRFHGFIKGWHVPRMRENMKAEGWGLNVEYFSEILHALRSEIRYRAMVDELLEVPKGADTRDTEAIKRLATGFLKLLFPHALSINDIKIDEFMAYCLNPARLMRATIRKQLHLMDSEYTEAVPEIRCASIT